MSDDDIWAPIRRRISSKLRSLVEQEVEELLTTAAEGTPVALPAYIEQPDGTFHFIENMSAEQWRYGASEAMKQTLEECGPKLERLVGVLAALRLMIGPRPIRK
jgi:hypothetical protein